MIKNIVLGTLRKIWFKVMMLNFKYKIILVFIGISFIVLIGANIAYLYLNMSFKQGLWWTWIHLMDPGFIANDNDNLLKMIVSSIISFLGMSVIAGIFLTILQQIFETILIHLKKGSIPKNINNHTILLGHGSKIKDYIEAVLRLQPNLLPKNILIIVPEDSFFEELKSLCHKDNLITVDNIINPDLINKFSFHNADRIIILDNYGGDISSFLDILFNLNLFRKTKNNLNNLKLYYELSDYNLYSILHSSVRKLISKESKIELSIMNINNINSRISLLNNPIDLKIKENSINSRIVFIFIGWSSFSDSLLNQIMRIGYYQCKTSIYIVVDNDIKSYENKINNSYPGLCDSNYAKEIISINYINSHALNNLSLGAKDTVSAVVCGNNPDKIFLQAIDITSNKITNLRYIFVEIPDGSGYNKVINAINNEQKNYSMVTVGSHSKAFELSEKMDKYAKLSHQKYLKEREDNGLRVQKFDGSYENSGDEDWENLDDTCRNWNRSPLDHSEIKLRVLANINNLPMHSRDSDTGDIFIHNSLKHKAISLIHHFKTKNTLNEDIELLSKLEHNRWSGEKFSEGWVFGKETNKSQKISSFLIPYEDLSDSIKQYDREQVIQQLENLIVIN